MINACNKERALKHLIVKPPTEMQECAADETIFT